MEDPTKTEQVCPVGGRSPLLVDVLCQLPGGNIALARKAPMD
jgi:hypothetical protein